MNRKQRVLLIEDQEVEAGVYGRAITRDGFEVDIVHNAEDAARFLDEKVYDVAVVDMSLSGIDGDTSGGEQVLAYARKVEEPPALVVFTSFEKPQFAADTIQEWGVARFVSKSEVTRHGSEPLLHGVKAALASVKPSRDRRKEILRVLKGSEQEAIWIDGILRTLKPDGGYAGLVVFLQELFSGLMPLLPLREIEGPQLRIGHDAVHCIGQFWSKGIGAPVFVDLRPFRGNADGVRILHSSGVLVESIVRKYELNGLQGTVQKISGSGRELYGS
jgi:ActR/RegA family two-component response regulator